MESFAEKSSYLDYIHFSVLQKWSTLLQGLAVKVNWNEIDPAYKFYSRLELISNCSFTKQKKQCFFVIIQVEKTLKVVWDTLQYFQGWQDSKK